MNSTIIYAADVSALKDPRLYSEAYDAASAHRKAKADRCRLEKDRRLALGAEALLRYALKEHGLAEFPDTFDYGEYGKPYLREQGLFFSLSHSGDWALCAVSGCELGCDIEKIRPVDLKVARRFAAEEYEDVSSKTDPDEQAELFFRYWTLKESFMKATGLGFKLALNDFRIVIGNEISVIQSADDRSYAFREFPDIPGYRCAVCRTEHCENAELKILDLAKLL